MKVLSLFFALLFLVNGCGTSSVSSTQIANEANATPGATATPVSLPNLTTKELERLEERLPRNSKEILEKAELIEVFETEVCVAGRSLARLEDKKFQGCNILRRAEVKDLTLRRKLLDEMFYAIGSSGSGAACSSPRHGIRAFHNGKRIEMLICFECENFRGVSSFGNFGGGFSTVPEKLFEQLLGSSK